MKKQHYQFIELLLLTGLFAILTVIAIAIGHERSILMIFLTVFMILITFVARFRSRRHVQTLQQKGRRRKA